MAPIENVLNSKFMQDLKENSLQKKLHKSFSLHFIKKLKIPFNDITW